MRRGICIANWEVRAECILGDGRVLSNCQSGSSERDYTRSHPSMTNGRVRGRGIVDRWSLSHDGPSRDFRVEARLKSELAVALYGQGVLPFGKTAELASTKRYASPSSPPRVRSPGITRRTIWPKTSTMRAVSNTSPISNLADIGRLDLPSPNRRNMDTYGRCPGVEAASDSHRRRCDLHLQDRFGALQPRGHPGRHR